MILKLTIALLLLATATACDRVSNHHHVDKGTRWDQRGGLATVTTLVEGSVVAYRLEGEVMVRLSAPDDEVVGPFASPDANGFLRRRRGMNELVIVPASESEPRMVLALGRSPIRQVAKVDDEVIYFVEDPLLSADGITRLIQLETTTARTTPIAEGPYVSVVGSAEDSIYFGLYDLKSDAIILQSCDRSRVVTRVASIPFKYRFLHAYCPDTGHAILASFDQPSRSHILTLHETRNGGLETVVYSGPPEIRSTTFTPSCTSIQFVRRSIGQTGVEVHELQLDSRDLKLIHSFPE